MMIDWYERTIKALQLNGKGKHTHTKKTGSGRLRTIALPVMKFIRRFLQHVLPTGFMKVRHYGFMSPTSSVKLDEIKALIELSYGFENEEAAVEITPAPHMACVHIVVAC